MLREAPVQAVRLLAPEPPGARHRVLHLLLLGVRSEEAVSITYIPGEPCPCGCGATGSKLAFKTGHIVRACKCQSCIGRRNRAKGQRAQAKGHRALGGIGFTPGNEESVGGYDTRLQVEWKTGDQIPASFTKFVGLDWTRRALSQANRARRVGDGSMPTVGIIIGGKTYLVVEANRDMDGVA